MGFQCSSIVGQVDFFCKSLATKCDAPYQRTLRHNEQPNDNWTVRIKSLMIVIK